MSVWQVPAVQRGPVSNRTPETRRLDLARAAFFRAVLKASERHGAPDYSGYRSMLMVDHTTMFWPVGRADDVVFVLGSAGRFLLTQWRATNGAPTRRLQIPFVEGKRTFPYGGTMSRHLGGVKATVPKRFAKPLKSLLQRQGYATYLGSAAMGAYCCGAVREDGSDWPGREVSLENMPAQDDSRVDRDGFAITDEELRLLATKRKG